MVSYAARMSSWQEMKLKTGKKKTVNKGYANSLKTICKSEELYASWFSSTEDFREIYRLL